MGREVTQHNYIVTSVLTVVPRELTKKNGKDQGENHYWEFLKSKEENVEVEFSLNTTYEGKLQ